VGFSPDSTVFCPTHSSYCVPTIQNTTPSQISPPLVRISNADDYQLISLQTLLVRISNAGDYQLIPLQTPLVRISNADDYQLIPSQTSHFRFVYSLYP
jgi:hypothetical protein